MKKSIYISADMLEEYVCDNTYSSIMLMGDELAGEPAININLGTLQPHTRLAGGRHEEAEIYYVVNCQEGAEVVTGAGDVADEEIHYKVKSGDVIFIPGGVHHWIDNRKCDEAFTIMTLWPRQEQNSLYHKRLADWGTSFRFKGNKK